MIADLIDIQGSKAIGKKWTPYPRPVKSKDGSNQRWGNTGGRTRAEIVEILNGLGHTLSA